MSFAPSSTLFSHVQDVCVFFFLQQDIKHKPNPYFRTIIITCLFPLFFFSYIRHLFISIMHSKCCYIQRLISLIKTHSSGHQNTHALVQSNKKHMHTPPAANGPIIPFASYVAASRLNMVRGLQKQKPKREDNHYYHTNGRSLPLLSNVTFTSLPTTRPKKKEKLLEQPYQPSLRF